ncbi:homeobox protein Hox-B4-like isoform X2 [Rhincodon typus]|uniref:homeobox protein Hox-B4-like isoform X2 n=1 Tax=Rhincodon typus TaxID=259920 RepID=UPI00202F022C|nr:homeobox protein Hox-B4-like isoform X2 [Rhincodon typus]
MWGLTAQGEFLLLSLLFQDPCMDQLSQNFHFQTKPSVEMEDCCFGQGAGYCRRSAFNCGQTHISPRDFRGSSGQHAEGEPWNPASNTTPSEADSQDDLERLNARGDSWLHSVEERELTEESISRKYKGRTIFSAEQLRVLQQRFQLQRYLTASEQQELGNAIGLTSQQVKTWFQNRRMKVKRLLKEPTASTQISFLQADLSQNNSVVYGKPMDNMKQQFTSYSLSHLLPRHLVPSPDKHWPSAGPVYPNLGKFQSTVIKSELQYTNQSVNFSIKKEAIALSSRPELKQMKLPATSYSHTIPVQHFDFSLQQALPGPPYLQQGLPYEVIKPAGDELHHEKVIIS